MCGSLVAVHNMGDKTQDLVAVWEVNLADGIHIIEFEHGTTSGKRVLRVDGEVIMKRDWMFKLVGNENFQIGKSKAAASPVGKNISAVRQQAKQK